MAPVPPVRGILFGTLFSRRRLRGNYVEMTSEPNEPAPERIAPVEVPERLAPVEVPERLAPADPPDLPIPPPEPAEPGPPDEE